MYAEKTTAKSYCNVLALQKGLDPGGHAGDFADALVMEAPLPWKRGMYQEAGTLPQKLVDLFSLWQKRYEAGEPYDHRPLLVAPDPVYSVPGYRRVMHYTRPSGMFAAYTKTEYLVPESELGSLAWALYEEPEHLDAFDAYRAVNADSTRDLLVCTHGTIDAACAKFGYPLYRDLRDNYASDTLRIWRASHFGGHVFAPTMMDMPTGHYWAYVESEQAEQIALKDGDVSALRGHYRGWAGLEYGFLQAAERELWQQYGWDWFAFRKSGRVLAQDTDADDPMWADVEIQYTDLQGQASSAVMRVEVERQVHTIATTGYTQAYPYAQYAVMFCEVTQKAG